MDGIKTIDDLIASKNLTKEELELFDDLIREAREREKHSSELSRLTRDNLERLSDGLNIIAERTAEIGKSMEQLLDHMETLYIRSMPDSKFHRE